MKIKFMAKNKSTGESGTVDEMSVDCSVKVNLGRATNSCIQCKGSSCHVPYWKWDDVELLMAVDNGDYKPVELSEG